MRKIYALLFAMIFLVAANLNAQVSVTATAGTPGPTSYGTLKLAFDAINAGLHGGVITVNVAGTINEISQAVLNSGAYTSVTIKPTAVTTISGSFPTSVIKLNGADNVTIDGAISGTTKDLTISNSGPGTVIWLGSANSTDGASNNTIKNAVVTGGGAFSGFAGISSSSSLSLNGLAEAPNANNTYTNNTVSNASFGIFLTGPSANEPGNIISNSIIHTLGHDGIYVAQQQGIDISGNTISGITSGSGGLNFQTSGIKVFGTISGGNIQKNIINNIRITGPWGCSGIELSSSSASANLTVSNNMIYDVASGGFSGANSIDDGPYGIAINSGGNYNIYYNSIDNSTNTSGITAALWISPNLVGSMNIRNNILANRQTTGTPYSIYSNMPASAFTAINFNDYFSTGSIGFLTSARATLAAWQAASLQDASSISIDPAFISPTNLHLNPAVSLLNALATPIAGITTDIDGDTRNVTTPDIGADEYNQPPCTSNNGGTVTSSLASICGSGNAILVSSGYSTGASIAYQWEYSTDLTNWFPVAGQINPLNGNTGSISTTTSFRLRVQCGAGPQGYSNIIAINVNNPQVTGATGNSRCGTGTVSLSATGSNLKWYAAATGGAPLATGSPFITPVISTTTNYYVSASATTGNATGGKSSTNGADGTNPTGGILFTATESFTLNSVVMYPTGSGTNTIQLLSGSGTAGTVLFSTTVTFNGADPSGVTVPIGWTIAPGTYTLYQSAANAQCWRDANPGTAFPPITYPYNIGTAAQLTNGTVAGFYYFFYDWNITPGCEGTRTMVTATINTPPAFTSVTVNPGTTVCSGTAISLNATGGGYTSYVWNPGNLSGAAQSVNPTVTTTYTLTATTATCRRDSSITVTVNPTPTTLTVTPSAAAICAGNTRTLVASGGILNNVTVMTELFETFPAAQFAATGTGITVSQNATYFAQGNNSVLLKGILTPNTTSQYSLTNDINLSLYTNPVLTFSQIVATEAAFDFGWVEYSLNSGGSWNTFPSAQYAGAGTLQNAVVSFDKSSYPDWNTQFTSATSTPGVGPAASLWKTETIDLTPYAGSSTFRIRFRLTSDAGVSYYGWLLDNIRISGNGQAPVSWSPVTDLYVSPAFTGASSVGVTITGSNTAGMVIGMPVVKTTGTGTFQAGTTIASIINTTSFTVNLAPTLALSGATVLARYLATPVTTQVITMPTANVTYTATATGGVGCSKTATATITAGTVPLSATISASPSGTFCAGTCVTFTANVVNGGSIVGYDWKVNGSSVSGGIQIGMSSITLCNLTNGQSVTVEVTPPGSQCSNPPTYITPGTTVSVNPRPSVSITGGGTVCNGAPTVLTGNINSGTVTSYQWYLNAGVIGGATTATYGATLPGSYTLVTTSNLGCNDTTTALVLTRPTYTITASAGANGAISPVGVTSVDCGNNQVYTFAPNPSYNLCDVLVDGISIGTPANYTFTNVTANHTIVASFCKPGCTTPAIANAGTNVIICDNATYTLTGTISGAATSATWTTSGTGTFNAGGVYPSATTYTPSANDITTGTVTLTLTTDDPDGGGPCTPSASSVLLTFKPAPVANVTGILGVCSAGAVSTTITVSGTTTAGTITGYTWSPSGTGTTHIYNTAGAQTVTTAGSNGCATVTPFTIAAFPTPTLSVSGPTTICSGTSIDLTALAVPGAGATIPVNGYQWYKGGVLIPGATSVVFAANSIGNYTVAVTNSNGCLSAQSSPAHAVTAVATAMVGNYTIGAGPASCTNYLSFAAAINDLNTRSISGNVSFDVSAGYIETLTAPLSLGSAFLNGTTAGRTITFTKSGGGANPVINAYTGTATPANAVVDGIWNFNGVDNVIIDRIDLNDVNTTNPATMEYGFGLFKLSANDGCQNIIIQNCNISLSRVNDAAAAGPMMEGSTGILSINALVTASNAIVTPGSAAGTNSNNKFYNNNIQNVLHGIALSGYDAPSPYTLGDAGNDIGGTVGTGNNIFNFGGSVSNASAPAGIRAIHQWGLNISNNTITNNNGSGLNTTNTIRGIWTSGNTTTSNGTATINNNIITLTSASTGSATTGIENALGAGATGNITINNNSVTGSNATAGTATWTGITNTAIAGTVTINNNTVQNISLPSSTGTLTGISNTAIATALTISGNIVSSNLKGTGTGTSVMTCMAVGPATFATVTNNSITGNSINAALTTGNVTLNCITGGGANGTGYLLNNNAIYNNSITSMPGATSLTGTVFGYTNAINSSNETITNNSIRRLFITGASTGLHVIRGLNNNPNAASVRTVSGNIIDSLYTNSTSNGAITGIHSQNGTTITILKNKISNLLPGQNAAALAIAKGIHIQSSGTGITNVYNNMINIDFTTTTSNGMLVNSNSVIGIDIASTTASFANLYYNTIRLAGTGSGSGFGSTGINSQNTTHTLDMRNNIVSNFMTPGGTLPGYTVALRRTTSATTGYSASSNNNVWYAGGISAGRALYLETTTNTNYNTIAGFAGAVGISPRESNSIDDAPVFISAINLHLDPLSNCNIEGGGQPISTPPITDDIDGEVRATNFPDIGADEFDATGGTNTWKGFNSNWLDPKNWCGVVPTITTDVIIPAFKTGMIFPIITTGTPVARNLTITPTGTVTINAGGTISLKGNVANSGTITNNGNMVLNGTTQQSFPGTVGIIAAMNTLEINNGSGVVINKSLDITGAFLPTLGTIDLGNYNITIASRAATGTARIGFVGSTSAFNYSGTGRFIVERFIPAHNKAWQLLSTPTYGQTVNQAWQEGNAPTLNGTPFYGTIVTGTIAGQGFDFITPLGSTVKPYNSVTGLWDFIPSTTSLQIADKRGYLVLVRGERSQQNGAATLSTATTLRTTGKIYAPGIDAPASSTVAPLKFESIGNPYASAIDFTLVSKPNVDNKFYVWDPSIAGAYGLGAFNTFAAPTWFPSTPSSLYPASTPVTAIQSGQAFLVYNSSGVPGTVTFSESNKIAGSQIVFRTGPFVNLSTRLYSATSSAAKIADANTVIFDDAYSNSLDENDAVKFPNSGENFGIKHGEEKLVFETRKPINSNDTIFYIIHNLRTQAYKLQFVPENIINDELSAYLVDKYLNINTPVSLSDSTEVDFVITSDILSSAPDRFMLVFKKIPRVVILSIDAEKHLNDVAITWKVKDEVNIASYEIQRSADGINFNKIGDRFSFNNGMSSYNFTDISPLEGDNFYRIRSLSQAGVVVFSAIAKINYHTPASEITIHPNPVQSDRIINISLFSKQAGRYNIKLVTTTGEVLLTTDIDHNGRSGSYPLKLLNVARGSYMVQVTTPDQLISTFKLIY